MKKVFLICGARPNFMKIAMVYKEMIELPKKFNPLIVHTGQHYDFELSGAFFKDLVLPKPDIYLGIGSGNHGEQTGKIMIALEKITLKEKPHLFVVVGDVNSTVAASLVAAKLMIPIAHIEAGLRSFDRTMPEEINRIVTDVLSDYLFTTEEAGNENLKREGIDDSKIFFVGDLMVDCLLQNRKKASDTHILKKLNLKKDKYGLITLHRPSNVDNKKRLSEIIDAFNCISKEMPLIFPIHPRTKKMMGKFDIAFDKDIHTIDPLSYLEFLHLEANAMFVLTDSGSIQVETSVFDIPCITIRNNTERPYTLLHGTNILVGTSRNKIITESLKIIKNHGKTGKPHHLWDGKAKDRVIKILNQDVY